MNCRQANTKRGRPVGRKTLERMNKYHKHLQAIVELSHYGLREAEILADDAANDYLITWNQVNLLEANALEIVEHARKLKKLIEAEPDGQ